MFITKRKHDRLMAIAGREIVEYQDTVDVLRKHLHDHMIATQSLRAELAAIKEKREKTNRNLRNYKGAGK